MAAQNLHHVRQVLGAELTEQVAQITREFDTATSEVAETPLMFLDNKKLRGIPAIGQGVDGAVSGTNPTDWIDAMADDAA